MEEPTFAIIYVRVSTMKQIEEGLSIDAQIDACKKWSTREDLVIKKIYRDEGKSGGAKEPSKRGVDKEPIVGVTLAQQEDVTNRIRGLSHRKGMIAALVHCQKGGILVTINLSRISRNMEQALQIFNYMGERGGYIYSIKEKLDTRMKMAKMYFHFSSLLSEMELDTIKERTNMAMEYKKQIGEFCGRIPYGWKHETGQKGDNLVEDEEEQKNIKRARKLHEQGKSYRAIAKLFNEEEIKTKMDKTWAHTTIKRIIDRKTTKTKGSVDRLGKRIPNEPEKKAVEPEKKEVESEKKVEIKIEPEPKVEMKVIELAKKDNGGTRITQRVYGKK